MCSIIIDFCDTLKCSRNNIFHLITDIRKTLLRDFVLKRQFWYSATILDVDKSEGDRFIKSLRNPLSVGIILPEFLLGESGDQVTQCGQVRQHVKRKTGVCEPTPDIPERK